jgi:hypothetical protein
MNVSGRGSRLAVGQHVRVLLRLKHLLCVPFALLGGGSYVVVYEPDEVYGQPASEWA